MVIAWCSVLLILSSNTAFAQNSVKSLPLPEQACSFSGSFTQTKQIDGLSEPLISDGVFYYHCEEGVIWKTQNPILQTLVFRQNGKAFRVQDDEAKPLAGAPTKLLGRLLNSLLGGDSDELFKLFEISNTANSSNTANFSNTVNNVQTTDTFRLLPRGRSLKRGLKEIELTLPPSNSDQPVVVEFAMLDRKQQWTRIVSTQNNTQDGAPNAKMSCLAVALLKKQDCNLLFGSLNKQ